MAQVAVPTGADVLAFLGWPSDPDLTAQADVHAEHVTLAASAYTRKRGFVVNEFSVTGWQCESDIAAAITSACARSLSNPSSARRIEAGAFNEMPGSFASWSLTEYLILNQYRTTAA